MGRGFDETGSKGAYICQVSPQGAQATFLPLGAGGYEDLTIPAGSDPLAAILAQLPPDASRDVYRITLTGEAEPVELDRLLSLIHIYIAYGQYVPLHCVCSFQEMGKTGV